MRNQGSPERIGVKMTPLRRQRSQIEHHQTFIELFPTGLNFAGRDHIVRTGLAGESVVIAWLKRRNVAWIYGKELMALDPKFVNDPWDVMRSATEITRRKIRSFFGARHEELLGLLDYYRNSVPYEKSCRGFPDLILQVNSITFMEVKTNTGTLLQNQRYFLNLAKQYGFGVILARVTLNFAMDRAFVRFERILLNPVENFKRPTI